MAGLLALSGCASGPAEAPNLPEPYAARSEVYRFRIGDMEAMALREGAKHLPNDGKIFGIGQTPETISTALTQARLAGDVIDISFQPLLVRAGDRLVLIDAGSGPTMGPLVGQLAGSLRLAGVDPAEITDIIISHSHPDHAAGLATADGRSAFPNAVIRMSSAEWAFMQVNPALASVISAIKPQVVPLEPGETLAPGIAAVALAGHTPGHIGVRMESAGDALLYIGDVLHHPVISVRHPEWPMVFDDDPAAATSSRRLLMESAARHRALLYAAHFPYPGLGRIEKRCESYVWVPESPVQR
ncbi:MAG TPA: MBL fold metallo-hydrolase [Brevundimonas sp.]|jgi:glyoxylase-like metal-dependent hydrolase (beta-lactamase superfamily II)